MKIRAPWGCDDPYCLDHVMMAVFVVCIPIFYKAVFQAIKWWDVERRPGDGLAGANGTDVMTILRAVRGVPSE